MIIDGKKLAQEILENLKEKRKNYEKLKIAAFLIGKGEEKLSFLKIKQEFAQELNIEFRIYELDENLSKRKIRKYLSQILKHKTIQGAIFQLPIPEKFSTQYLLNSIPAKKDIDCLSSRMLGKFYTDNFIIRPPAVEVVDFLKEKFNLEFRGKNVLIVGYGRLAGKPLAHYFANLNSTVIIAQSQTKIENYLKITDIIVSGVGKANLIQDCQKGAILIDFGYSFEKGKIYGDIDFEKLKDKASLITPTPGGTGPILVAKLFENFFKLLEKEKVVI
ncbi:MAG: bifunctional protein FolD [Candidatus Parcubacteria bacterium]|nr:MAG: bifunctional protein FolD [Candidatus Parcubacteria bacterium]